MKGGGVGKYRSTGHRCLELHSGRSLSAVYEAQPMLSAVRSLPTLPGRSFGSDFLPGVSRIRFLSLSIRRACFLFRSFLLYSSGLAGSRIPGDTRGAGRGLLISWTTGVFGG